MNKLLILVAVITLSSCSMEKKFSVDACPSWADNIHNPDNEEFVEEVAFNLGITTSQVTQSQFNKRYEL
jgi:hypothetical protein